MPKQTIIYLIVAVVLTALIVGGVYLSKTSLDNKARSSKRFNTTPRDFICNDTTYLNLRKSGDELFWIDVYEKIAGFGNYHLATPIVRFEDGNSMSVLSGLPLQMKNEMRSEQYLVMKPEQYLTMCKNKEGKSPSELYPRYIEEDSLTKLDKEVSLKKELLIGVWQSVEDPNSSVYYLEDGTWKELFGEETFISGTWELITTLPVEVSGKENTEGYFIKTIESSGDNYYHKIESVDNKWLWLTYLTSGQKLQYKRVQ